MVTQAAAAERDDEPGDAVPAAAGRIEVTHAGGEAYAITIRDHTVVADHRRRRRRWGPAATPTELLVASLASCVAYYAGRYLARHDLDRGGLASWPSSPWPPTGPRGSAPSG